MQITRIRAHQEDRKVRVAVYCRVSKKLETQEDSLEEKPTKSLSASVPTGNSRVCMQIVFQA